MTDDATPNPAATAPADVAATPSVDVIETDTPTSRRCPWCSELLAAAVVDRCPACHANLVAGAEARVPGVTEVEGPTAVRERRAEPPKRSKLLSWISGDIDEEASSPVAAVASEAVALPPRDVRREMLRLKLEAEGLTVGADGTIELPTNAATSAPADGHLDGTQLAETATVDTAAEDIRKAS